MPLVTIIEQAANSRFVYASHVLISGNQGDDVTLRVV